MIDLFIILKIAGIIGLLITLAKVAGKVGAAGARLLSWLLYGILGIIIIWALYNKVAEYTGWWDPITLDDWLRNLLSKLPFIGKYFQG